MWYRSQIGYAGIIRFDQADSGGYPVNVKERSRFSLGDRYQAQGVRYVPLCGFALGSLMVNFSPGRAITRRLPR